ncbi:hypothetical protein F5Y17DRAFT_331129 [Xylariaceae sp. FL0594]|nr:hypothetical protein F5Y17DRAFT_331129 [Xylariaceae sp. FL0594]
MCSSSTASTASTAVCTVHIPPPANQTPPKSRSSHHNAPHYIALLVDLIAPCPTLRTLTDYHHLRSDDSPGPTKSALCIRVTRIITTYLDYYPSPIDVPSSTAPSPHKSSHLYVPTYLFNIATGHIHTFRQHHALQLSSIYLGWQQADNTTTSRLIVELDYLPTNLPTLFHLVQATGHLIPVCNFELLATSCLDRVSSARVGFSP